MLVYLAGAMNYYAKQNKEVFDEKAVKWRQELKHTFYKKIEFYDPTENFYAKLMYKPECFVVQNDYYLKKCDIAVVNLENINESPGTIYELATLKYMNKPVIAFGGKENIIHPHIKSCINAFFDTLDDVIEYFYTFFVD